MTRVVVQPPITRAPTVVGEPVPSSAQPKAHAFTIALVLVMGVALALRAFGLHRLGLFTHDPAIYANEGTALALAAKWLAAHLGGLFAGTVEPGELIDYVRANGGALPRFGKPGHALVVSFAFLAFGIRDWVYLGVGAVLGTALVLLVYRVGRAHYDARVGLAAGTFLAVSQYAIIFSRNGMADTTSAFFAFLATAVYLLRFGSRERGRWPFVLAALTLGFAFTTNYKIFIVPLLFVGYELFLIALRRQREPAARGLGRVLLFTALIAVPLLAMELPYLVLGRVGLALSEAGSTFPSYFEQLAYRFTRGPEAYPASFGAGLTHYARSFLWLEGPLLCVFALVGILTLAARLKARARMPDLVLLTQVLVPFALWTVFNGGRASLKPLVVILPALALVSAVGLVRCVDLISGRTVNPVIRRAALPVLLAAVLLLGGARVFPLLGARSAFPSAIGVLVSHLRVDGGSVNDHADSIGPLLKFYLGEQARVDPSGAGAHVRFSGDADATGDYRVLVGPAHRSAAEFRQLRPWRIGPEEYRLTRGVRPVLVVANEMYRYPAMLFTNYPAIKSKLRPEDTAIRIFDLRAGKSAPSADGV